VVVPKSMPTYPGEPMTPLSAIRFRFTSYRLLPIL
jgi:hypothetical protein